MLFAPGTLPDVTHKFTRAAAERVATNWWRLLLNGLLLIVAGVLIFSIDWSIASLATFIGALFIVEGVTTAVTSGIDARVGRANVISGLVSIAAGIAIIVWPAPGIVALAIFLGAWLIVVGTITISGSLAARRFLPYWWLLLITGLLEIPLGVLALANPGATLTALVLVAGVWAVAIGVSRVVISFELKRLPHDVDQAFAASANSTSSQAAHGSQGQLAAAAHSTAPRPNRVDRPSDPGRSIHGTPARSALSSRRLSRVDLRAASRQGVRGAVRWTDRLRSNNRRGLACSSGFQHLGRSAA
jgi:uncharacterized membrane protein HdeD (DUF308 family)